MKISEHPYSITSFVFLVLIILGKFLFDWKEDYYAFVLLLYCIVSLGIRLDDIAKLIGSMHTRPTQISDDEPSIIGQLGEIKASLLAIENSLGKILVQKNRETLNKFVEIEDFKDKNKN